MAEPTTVERGRDRGRLIRPVLRWVFLLVATAVAFHGAWRTVLLEASAHTEIVYIYLVPLLMLIAFVGVTAYADPGPPIKDRQTDLIVGTVVLILAVGFQVMLVPRFSPVYLTLHLDLLAAWLFLLGCSVLLFGTRPTARYRWVWVVALGIFPLPNRVLAITFGASSVALGAAYIGFGMLAAAVATGSTRRRAFLGAAVGGIGGLIALAVLALLAPGADQHLYVLIPATAAALTGSLVLYAERRRRSPDWHPLARTVRAPTVPNGLKTAAVISVVAAGLAFVPTPTVTGETYRGAVTVADRTLEPPAGWNRLGETSTDWVSQYYGPGATLTRQTWRQAQGDLRWDPLQRPRTIVVDTLRTRRPITLGVYPLLLLYEANGSRFSYPADALLDGGVLGAKTNIVDDRTRVSYTRLSWQWHWDGTVESVSMIAVDDHRESATFPLARPTAAKNLGTLASVLLRGNLVIRDFSGELKDDELLTLTANRMIAARLRPGASA
ncbi:YfhO family protein [Tsukamurella sputi]|uniref:YfhO family protein n=1 Tax=Tsukamurella sputi TaxID=2591848 RepID=A0A5C5RLY7_9ACTN|nr:YfhO family protein [Tsukamurella sputi]TWS23211.1 YfhO family protein [Tsukamurella sputi]